MLHHYPGTRGSPHAKVYNIEMDPRENLNVGGIQFWPMQEGFKTVGKYLASPKKYPNPPAINFTNFGCSG